MRILYGNFLSSLSTLASQSEDPLYPLTNLYDTRLSRTYRSLTPTATEYVRATVTAAPCYVVITGHNVSSSATVYVEASTESAFTSTGKFSTTIPWSSGVMYTYFASTSKPYWQIKINNISTALSYLEISHLRFSTYIEMPGMKPDQSIKDETTAKVDISESGQAYGNSGYDFRSPSINFPYLSNTERENIRTMWAAVHNYIPVHVLFWPNSTSEEKPLYGIINQNAIDWKRSDDRSYRWTTSINFREVF